MVGTDLVDAGSLLAAGILLTLVHITVTEPALPAWRAGAGERAEDLHTGGVIQTGGRVALGCVVGGGEVLSDTVQSPLLLMFSSRHSLTSLQSRPVMFRL